jgi:hypothetical protein
MDALGLTVKHDIISLLVLISFARLTQKELTLLPLSSVSITKSLCDNTVN